MFRIYMIALWGRLIKFIHCEIQLKRSDDLFRLIMSHKLIISSNEFSLFEKY